MMFSNNSSMDLQPLFLFLIESCASNSAAEEQRSLSQFIEPLFTTAVEVNAGTYSFLIVSNLSSSNALKFVGRNKSMSRKEELGKSKKTLVRKSSSTQRKVKNSPSTAKDLKPSTSSPVSAKLNARSPLSSIGESHDTDNVQRLLKAIEMSGDDLATILLCRLLHGFVMHCKVAVSHKRFRRMVRLDAANYCLRAMRAQLQENNPSPMRILAIDALAKTLMAITVKDRKFMLKARISGILPLLANRVLEADRLFTTITLLKFTFRCLRSPRNAQLFGREKCFAERFVALLNAFAAGVSTLQSGPSISNAASDYYSSELPSVSALLQRTQTDDALLTTEKMARLVEILFFVVKNKRTRAQMLDHQVMGVLKTIFENHFERRNEDAIHFEISLITLATIRQLSKTKKGREQLTGFLEMCEKCISLLTVDRNKYSNRPKALFNYVQLQDSLCALCLRCLPQTQFPLDKSTPFPLKFPVYATNSAQKPKVQKLRQRRASSSKGKEDYLENGASSDFDEDEEDSVVFFNSNFAGNDSLLNMNETDLNYSDEDDDFNAANDKADVTFSIANYSRQSVSKLKSTNEHLFAEFGPNSTVGPSDSPMDGGASSSQTEMNQLINCARQTKSVGTFEKIAFPELSVFDATDYGTERSLLLPSTELMREVIVQEMAKSRLQSTFKRRVVFDLDQLIIEEKQNQQMSSSPGKVLDNSDLNRLGMVNENEPLKFESRFESGNLRKAIQVSQDHYELILSPDINQHHAHHQWFYFEVSNIKAGVTYTFEIINCLKNSSMFSRGMQPVLFSVMEASKSRVGWVRAAANVCYYRNLYDNSEKDEESKPQPSPTSFSGLEFNVLPSSNKPVNNAVTPAESSSKPKAEHGEMRNYFSVRFSLKFQHHGDICYLAYHFPYTYSFMNGTLESVIKRSSTSNSLYIKNDLLTKTLAGNPVPLLTVTSACSAEEMLQKEIILFSARVHPGESNASWVMHGIIKFLTSDAPQAVKAREMFVFKLVPMLNPDGVINGSHRCSLAGVDLNRVWNSPSQELHPTVFHTKGLIQYMVDVLKKRPYLFIDLHGHSRRPNIFLYGNNPEESWRPTDHSLPHDNQFSLLPDILDKIAPGFSLQDCRFSITKSKEFSARIAMWRQFGLERVYTMESTYCGFDTGRYAGKQITISDLMEMGKNLCEAVILLKTKNNQISSCESTENGECDDSSSTVKDDHSSPQSSGTSTLVKDGSSPCVNSSPSVLPSTGPTTPTTSRSARKMLSTSPRKKSDAKNNKPSSFT